MVLPKLRACECGPFDKPYLKGLAEELDRQVKAAGGWFALRDRLEQQKAHDKEERAKQLKPLSH